MQTLIEPIWKPCSKEEYERACTKLPYDWFFDYRKKPIYDKPAPQGLLAQLEPDKRKIVGYEYFKRAGQKKVLVCSEFELRILEKGLRTQAADTSDNQ